MKQISYDMPKYIKTDENGFRFLAGLYDELHSLGQNILVNFGTCSLIDGNLAAIIGAVFDKLTSEEYNISLLSPKSQRVKQSLGRNGFFKAWKIETTVQERENYITYRTFRGNNVSEFTNYIREELIHKQLFPTHTKMVGRKIEESVYEIYANALMHGLSDCVTCCGEYDATTKVLHMTIVDCGISIPQKVNNFFVSKGKELVSASEAINWAFIDGHTTKDVTGGLGLGILKEFIGLNKGVLHVLSGKGFVQFEGINSKYLILDNDLPGTIINMNINFNDDSVYYMKSEKDEIDINNLL